MIDQPLPAASSLSDVNPSPQPAVLGRTIALVSGKGGSGKTIIGSVMMEILAERSEVILVDADFGTRGLSFFLGLDRVSGISDGLLDLSDAASSESHASLSTGHNTIQSLLPKVLKPVKDLPQAKFLSAGDVRQAKHLSDDGLRVRFATIVSHLKQAAAFVVFDCRGGIDEESLAVCSAVDDVILIVEMDTTSYQATRQLVSTLVDNKMGGKLKGFILNKVFENPSFTVRSGRSDFQAEYLGSIPFDFETMRSFFVGNVPNVQSVFAAHVQRALHQGYSANVPEPLGRTYRPDEYQEVGLLNLDSLRGGLILSMGILIASVLLCFYWYHLPGRTLSLKVAEVVCLLAILGLAGSLNSPRQLIGRLLNRVIGRLLYLQRN